MFTKYVLPLILVAAVLALGVLLPVSPATFKAFQATEIFQLLAGIVLIALFLERALEVFMTTWRRPDAAQLDVDLRNRRNRIRDLEAEKTPSDEVLASLRKERADLEVARADRAKYRSDTQRFALWTSLILGMIVSAVGFRVLQQLVEPSSLDGIDGGQQYAFHAVDVLLTGGLLAGGSDSVHKLMQIYTTFMDVSQEKARERH